MSKFPKEIILEIKQEDIDAANEIRKLGNFYYTPTKNCPASIAAQRQFGIADIRSAVGYMHIFDDFELTITYYNDDMHKFQNKFDYKKPVEPTTFKLERK